MGESRIQFFGEYLVARDLITREALADALGYQRSVNLPIGFFALQQGKLSELQVLRIHSEQRQSDRKFGEIAVEKGFLSADDLEALLEGQAEVRVYLGEALVGRGHLTRTQLDEALAAFHTEQIDAERRVHELLQREPERDLFRVCLDLTVRMLLRMARVVGKVRSAERNPGPVPEGCHTFRQSVNGDKAFKVALSLQEPLLLSVATALLASVMEEPPREVDEFVLDAGREFLNICVGHVCTQLALDELKLMPEPPEAGGLDQAAVRLVILVGRAEGYLDVSVG